MRKPNGYLDPVQMLSAVVLLLIILGTGYFLYEVAYKDNPPIVFFGETEVVDVPVRPGGTIHLISDFCRTTDATVTIYTSFIDGEIRSLDKIESGAFQAECRENHMGQMDVPTDLPLGEYIVRWRMVYNVRVFFNVVPLPRTVIQESEPFLVVE